MSNVETSHAWEVALGRQEGSEVGLRIRGAINDYNSRGRGSTTVRRVLRNGSWQWVSAPASRGRYLADDRRDVKYGDVFEGEIIAEYTLGSKKPTPDRFWLVVTKEEQEKPLLDIDHVRIKSGYRLLLGGCEVTIDVPDPTWR